MRGRLRLICSTHLLTIACLVIVTVGDTPGQSAAPSREGSTATMDETAKANAFFDKAFEELLERSPQFQTRLGRKTHYDEWDDISETFGEATRVIVQRQLSEAKRTIDPARLDHQTRLSYELFVTEWERRVSDFEWRHHDYPLNQMYGLQSTVPSFLINYHRIASEDDANAYIARLDAVPRLFEQLIDGMRIRADKGVIPPKFVFAYVLEDSRNVIVGAPFDDSGEDSAIYADFKKKIDAAEGIPDERKRALTAKATRSLTHSIRPAYESLIAYVSELESRATSDDGAWKLPDGAAYYRHELQKMTTTDLSATEIHDIGRAEVARIHDEMREIMRGVGFEGSLHEFFELMRTDERFYFDESEEGKQAYLEGARNIIDTMRARLDNIFNIKPRAELIVKAVEPFREKSAGKAFYQRPSPDGTRPGVYYANLYRMADMPIYQMEALAYHEGIPGHHMQLAIAQELEGIPSFRKYARYTAYTEGWGLYTEYLPKEIGFYEDPYSDFGRLAMELWRACRLVVDTGIHDKQWTREQAIAYLVENTPNSYGDAVKAIERYIVMPGQATAYKIGMLKILELRERARETLGERFDIREFHDVVLKNGAVPLGTLEDLIDDWIADEM